MIDLNTGYKKIEAYTRGRKEKIWFSKDGTKYLYKFGASYYEIYAELIAEKLGTQCGIEMANYNVATYNNSIGVLTKNFLKTGELIISSDKLKKAVSFIYEENNINGNLSDNTISNLLESAFTYDPTINTEKLYKELVKRWIFYGTIMESDKNETNIGFIKGVDGFTLTPDYDNSSMAALNKNISNILESLRHGYSIYSLTDSIKSSFKISNEDTGYFLQDFENFAKKYPAECAYCIACLSRIDVDAAFERVEVINNVEIPWEIKYWVSKLINSRLQDMQSIYERCRSSQSMLLKK